MRTSRIVYALVAICGSLSLAYTPAEAAMPAEAWECTDCYITSDGMIWCAACEPAS
jgi:hypothetical protein